MHYDGQQSDEHRLALSVVIVVMMLLPVSVFLVISKYI